MVLVVGTSGDDDLTGGFGEDILRGLGGDDRLTGGPGGDFLDGGDGLDKVVYKTGLAGVSVNLHLNMGLSGDALGDTYSGIEGVAGTEFSDNLTGDHLDNQLIGLAGDDTLIGRGGNDRIRGGAGGDILDGGDGIDTMVYAQSKAGVTVDLASNSAASGDAEGDTISGFENLTGSGFADQLTGNDARNRLVGKAGNDVLRGLGGDDTLIGGAGNDQFDGGMGIDLVSYHPAVGNVVVNLRSGQVLGAAAGDTFVSIEALRGTQESHNPSSCPSGWGHITG